MVTVESILKVADNSGIRSVKCLKFLDGVSKNTKGTVGNLAVVSVSDYKKYKNKSTRKVFLGVIVAIKQWLRRKTGFYVRAGENRIVLLDNKEKILAKAIKGPVSINVKKQNINKVVFLAKVVF